ncbi:MAG: prepilin-type N-terminal cleavage/methylation domain-containing protein [Verrucomicrobia bacterium]|nr:prepilin-type N-terminal cleavage/methylation domain-containing protein [Verrucomicrobiota bacterium]
MNSSSSPLTRRGFTLIEVLVATAIMVIIVLAVVTIASDTFKAYDRVVANLTTQSEARSVLDAMEGDFQTAVMRRDGRCWMEVILPGGSGSNMPSGTSTLGDLQSEDHPILMLFASPLDRPRWLPTASGTRTALKGDVCAVAYRFGQSSPFDSPGEKIQQIYGVYRTIIDSENTYANALPLILSSVPLSPTSGPPQEVYPFNYWNASRTFHNYNTSTANDTKPLMYFNYSSPPLSWTLDQSNMIGSNIVAMNLIFWCRSNESTATPVLRAICPKGASTNRYTSKIFDPTIHNPLTDVFTGRLQITSDSIYTDDTLRNYSLKAVEVSLTVLSPDGVKELKALQNFGTQMAVKDVY